MAHAEQSVVVDRPAEAVFAFLADGLNESLWRPDVIAVEPAIGSGVGTVWRQTMKGPGGRTIRGDYRITRSDEPDVLEFEVIAGPARPTGRFVLETAPGDATKVTFTLDLQPKGVMRLMAGPIAKQVEKEVQAIRNLPAAMGAR